MRYTPSIREQLLRIHEQIGQLLQQLENPETPDIATAIRTATATHPNDIGATQLLHLTNQHLATPIGPRILARHAKAAGYQPYRTARGIMYRQP